MTDEELIARLREGATWDDDIAAADRIEALEAKLAKVVEIGNKMAHSIEENYYLPNIAGEWRKVAAEIKGENDE
jgi:hypothetical protein